MNKKLVAGIVAHVDSGKTTLAEGILYTCQSIRKLGRVDHKDSVLDNFDIERERGITVFTKQANVRYNEVDITLLDTPGHVDFSAEMERTLPVLDVAILVVSALDGIQGHTLTLYKLLKRYNIPMVIFVNKMDQPGADKNHILQGLKSKLSDNVVDFSALYESETDKESFFEEVSLADEDMLSHFLETGEVETKDITDAVMNRKIFPCIFGSALYLDGVDKLLGCIETYTVTASYKNDFGAKVFKISREDKVRLTWIKILGGSLKVKSSVNGEKVDQIRKYNGAAFEAVNEAFAGEVVALVGLNDTKAGDGIGTEEHTIEPLLVPVLSYQVNLPDEVDTTVAYKQLSSLSEEIPEMLIGYNSLSKSIYIHVMGEVQTEIIKRICKDRFGYLIELGKGNVLYKETIASASEGIGHYEPLKHYSEVHLLLEPLERGSGLIFESKVGVDDLNLNWQRLILTHLEEKDHLGILTGSPITDMKITVIGGRAHIKHTEGGDFRQSTYRAVRHGLMHAIPVLLEPVMEFTLVIPSDKVGRAMADIQKLKGEFEAPDVDGDNAIIKGHAFVSLMHDYQKEVNTYTKGMGKFTYFISGYEECHNTEEVIEELSYNPDADTDNPSSSVFCAHGAGFVVPWFEVRDYAHVDCTDIVERMLMGEDYKSDEESDEALIERAKKNASKSNVTYISQEEIEKIYKTTYKKNAEDLSPGRYIGKNINTIKSKDATDKPYVYKPTAKKDKYLLVDGYNIIFAWPKLAEIAKDNLHGARDMLVDICSNYQASMGMTLILVFDAYKVKDNGGSKTQFNNIYVVYTKEAETADMYIEKTVHEMAKKNDIMVATSDRLEQMIIYGEGATRLSAREFIAEVERENEEIRNRFLKE